MIIMELQETKATIWKGNIVKSPCLVFNLIPSFPLTKLKIFNGINKDLKPLDIEWNYF